MQAVVFLSPTVIAVQRVPVPTLEDPCDAIVRVDAAGVCGSDLHSFHGREPCDAGTIFGHEAVGTIISIGCEVKRLAVGMRVVTAFSTSCGTCAFCATAGLSARCVSSRLFGWKLNSKGLSGCQAEYVRIPHADGTLLELPVGLSAEEGLLIGDIFSTGLFASVNAGVIAPAPGDSACGAEHALVAAGLDEGTLVGAVSAGAEARRLKKKKANSCAGRVFVVVGCGPVGLCAITATLALLAVAEGRGGSPDILYAIDSVPARVAIATSLGARGLLLSPPPPPPTISVAAKGPATVPAATGPAAPVTEAEAVNIIRDASADGAGAYGAIECVGAPAALALSLSLLRPGGILSIVGVHTQPFPFGPASLYDSNITLRIGRCPARSLMPHSVRVMELAKACGIDIAQEIISHRLSLADAVEGYALFDRREATKVVLYPGGPPPVQEIAR